MVVIIKKCQVTSKTDIFWLRLLQKEPKEDPSTIWALSQIDIYY